MFPYASSYFVYLRAKGFDTEERKVRGHLILPNVCRKLISYYINLSNRGIDLNVNMDS